MSNAPPDLAGNKYNAALRVVGRRGAWGMALGVAATLIQAGAEAAVGAFIQVFLVAMEIVDASLLPLSLARGAGLKPTEAAGILVALGAFRSLGAFLSGQCTLWTSEYISGRIRGLAIHSLLFPQSPTLAPNSETQFRQGDLAARATQFTAACTNAAGAAFQGGAYLSLMVFLAWRESLVALSGMVGVFLALRFIQRAARRAGSRLPPLNLAYNVMLERVLRNRILISLLRLEQLEEENLLVGQANVQRANVRTQTIVNFVNSFAPALGLVVVAGVVVAGTFLNPQRLSLLTMLYFLFRLVQCGQNFMAQLTHAQVMHAYFDMAASLFLPEEPAAISAATRRVEGLPALGSSSTLTPSPSALADLRPGPTRPPALVMNGVCYSYPETRSEVLSGVSLSVPSGSQVAIVGPSGSGKSTLLSLLLGLVKPTSGAVEVDGTDACAWRATMRPRIGYVGAEPFLIMGTVADNLNYGLARPAPEDRLFAVLKFVQLDQFANPAGLLRTISEDMQGLSAGQKQRICLARALLVDPDLLVLDEATANVDIATESLIADALRGLKGTTTTVIVTHRRGLLAHADLVLEMGQLNETAPRA